MFPISRDPPEGGTSVVDGSSPMVKMFPISRDPPEGGTGNVPELEDFAGLVSNF